MQPRQTYDYIIAGAGCAGLSLAMQLQASGLPFKKVLLVDQDQKNRNDRTWCFWSKEEPGWLSSILFRQWDQLLFKSNRLEKSLRLAPYRYYMIRGIDFYTHCLSVLKQDVRFELITDKITKLASEKNGAVLTTAQSSYSAKYIFNSAFRTQNIKAAHVNYVQHFKGWLIETPQEAFDPQCPVFMDFRTEQHNDCRFIYLLPFSKNKALIEYTGFSKDALPDEEYDQALSLYIKDHLKGTDYTIVETERGQIPMNESAFVNPYGANVVNIGSAGGASKPGTGYTFYFIQQQCKTIVEQLKNNVSLIHLPERKKRFSFYDKTLLHVLNRKNIPASEVFTLLFQKNEITDVLAFLNDESSVVQDLRILSSLPKKEFAAAALESWF